MIDCSDYGCPDYDDSPPDSTDGFVPFDLLGETSAEFVAPDVAGELFKK